MKNNITLNLPDELSSRDSKLALSAAIVLAKHNQSYETTNNKRCVFLKSNDLELCSPLSILLFASETVNFDSQVESLVHEIFETSVWNPKLFSNYSKVINSKSTVAQAAFFAYLFGLSEVPKECNEWFHKHEKDFTGILHSLPKGVFFSKRITTVDKSVLVEIKDSVLPVDGEKNILITSALPYVNNVPHLGNIIGCVLSADVYARYCRLKGYNALYICGTDEYGTATETKAIEDGVTCQELCDKYHALHKEIYEWFDISFDYFGRTTTTQQTEISQEIFLNLHKNNRLEEQEVSQLFCEHCKRFLADRYVEGTCPLCGYEDARGDQCDSCGKLLNATELKNPRCKLDGKTPIIKSSRHVFIKLHELQSACEAFVKESSVKGKWSQNSISVTNAWLRDGLKSRCITRDLKWGTPVPLEHLKDKVFYVWFDAPIGYLSITANYTTEWERWWKNPENVSLYQFMGKDNIPFHTVIFPCSLLGTDEKYTMLHHLSTTEYLNYEDGKFSKSRNVGVFGNNVKDSGIPVCVWRYYLLANRPETGDSAFHWDEFAARTNNELLANLGNFVSRVLKFISAKYKSVLPKDVVISPLEKELIKNINSELAEYSNYLDDVKIKAALKCVMSISALGNGYLTEAHLDNNLMLNSPEICSTVMNVAANLIYLLSALFYPFIPSTSLNILKQLNAPLRNIPSEFDFALNPGHEIGQVFHLFKRIDETETEKLKMQYSGKDK